LKASQRFSSSVPPPLKGWNSPFLGGVEHGSVGFIKNYTGDLESKEKLT
jgi:hypothetical protein